MSDALKQRLREMVEAVERDPDHIGVLSTGERCAVALIMNEPKLLAEWDTMLYAARRVGAEWLEACFWVQRDRT